jgi:23S rRNA (uracil1939-C5)-methyltransferase
MRIPPKPGSNKKTSKPSDKTFEITVDNLVYGGFGLARYQGKVVFVPFSAPGDRLRVRVEEEKKNLIKATIIEILEPGAGRQPTGCRYFGICGGCQWQHLEYSRQVEIKRRILEEIFHHRIPQTRKLLIGMKASPQQYGYRSRARFHTSGCGPNTIVGFLRYQSHKIEDIEACPLLRPVLNAALGSLRSSHQLKEEDPGPRQIEIACAEETGIWGMTEMEQDLDGEFPADAGLGSRKEEILLHRRAGEFNYAVSPSVFFQANDFMLDNLISEVCALAKDSGTGSALDLFAGVGLFTLPLASRFQSVVAVERSAAACSLCTLNVKAAGFANIRTVCADVAAWMNAMSSIAPPAFDLLVLDPPRAGVGATVMNQIREWGPETILYVSCDPQTLCRDVSLLAGHGYEIDFIEGLDLFPQTYHFETILRLRRT